MTKKALMPVQHVSVSIATPPAEVYAFVAKPANLPRWAQGLAKGEGEVEVEGDTLTVESPMGRVKVKLTKHNAFNILDHDVTLPSGETVHNPLRVLPNGGGSEVVFSVFRQPSMDDAAFEKDVESVQRDLHALKSLLE